MTLSCPKCRSGVDPRGGGSCVCPSCALEFEAYEFSPPPEQGPNTGALVQADESVCFFHEAKKAEGACSSCGRFVCGLCLVTHRGKAVCPTCFGGRKVEGLATRHIRTDSLALVVAIVPPLMSFGFLAVLSAPATVYLCLKHWNSPPALTQSRRAATSRRVLALVLALAQIAGGVTLWVVKFA